MGSRLYNVSPGEAETRGSQRDQPGLHRKFRASQIKQGARESSPLEEITYKRAVKMMSMSKTLRQVSD